MSIRSRVSRRGWLVFFLIVGLVVVWGVLAGRELVLAAGDARSGQDRLDRVQAELGATDLIRGAGLEDVAAARAEFARAHDHARSWWVTPLRWLPVVGRQVRSVDALTGAAAGVTEVSADAMEAAQEVLETADTRGPGRVALVERLGVIADRASRALADIDVGPDDALVAPLADARDELAADLDDVRAGFADVGAATDGLAPLLAGPARYLVFAANNAEMRAGSGMFLSVGVLEFDDGSFSLSEMTPTGDLTLPPGAVAVTGDFAARWGWTDPSQEWRNLAMTPRFDASASLARRMWEWRTGEEVDGVLALDPIALRSILAATGPVDVDGEVVSADTVVDDVLFEQYLDLLGEDFEQAARRERLGTIARATVAALDAGDWDTATLLEELRVAADGRHVLAWSPGPVQQQGWRGMGISGRLADDSVLLAVMNRGGNKLDQFLGVSARIDVDPGDDRSDVTVRVTITNDTPAGLPRYLAGPFPGRDYPAGTYVGLFSLDVPGAARDVTIDDGVPLVAAGSDGPARVVATDLSLTPGATRELVVRFSLPGESGSLAVEPTARVPGVEWSDGEAAWVDGSTHTVRW